MLPRLKKLWDSANGKKTILGASIFVFAWALNTLGALTPLQYQDLIDLSVAVSGLGLFHKLVKVS